jgi:hypothetical protein
MTFKHILLLCSLGGLTACDGGSSSNSVTEGIQVSFSLTHQQSADATGNIPKVAAGQKTFKTREGIVVTLKQAYLVVWSVTLETACNGTNFVDNMKFPTDLLISPAAAHTDTTPTQLGVPNVINLLADDAASVMLGTIYPAPTTYCGITVALMQADEDAPGLLDYPINMLNRVLYIEGEYTPLGTTTPIAFTIDTAKTPRPKQLRLAIPLTLSATTPVATVDVITHYDRWFDAVDFSQLTETTQIDWILNNVTESLTQ